MIAVHYDLVGFGCVSSSLQIFSESVYGFRVQARIVQIGSFILCQEHKPGNFLLMGGLVPSEKKSKSIPFLFSRND